MAPRRKSHRKIKLQIQAGRPTSPRRSAPLRSARRQTSWSSGRSYNAATEEPARQRHPRGEITVYEDRSFTFELKTPPASRMLLKAAGVQKGSAEPHKTKVAKISWDQVREIAEFKKADLSQRRRPGRQDHRRDCPGRWASPSRVRLRRPTGVRNVGGTLRPDSNLTNPTRLECNEQEQQGPKEAAAKIGPRQAVHPRLKRPSWPRRTSSKKLQDATVEGSRSPQRGIPAKTDRWCGVAQSCLPTAPGKTARVAVFAVGEG